jgi:hypothetical protein
MATEYRRDSVYRSTELENSKYLDIWEPTISDVTSLNTKSYKIESKYHQRPDALSHKLYGNAKLWWVFAMVNQDKLNDPITDFSVGLTIQVPVRFT